MSNQRLAEANVRDTDAAPSKKLGDGGKILEPQEHLVCTSRNTHVCEERNRGCNGHAIVRHTRFGTFQEEPRRLLVLSNSEKITGSRIQEGVAGRRSRCQDDSVDDMRENWDTGVLDCNDPGRCGRAGLLDQPLIVGGDHHANGERTQDIKEEDTPENTSNSLGNVPPWVGSLTSSNSDHFHTTVGESRIDKNRPQSSESSSVTVADVFLHGAWVFPVAESQSIALGAAAKVDDEGQNEQSNDGNDLDTCKDKFGFAVYTNRENVQTDDEDDDDRDPCGEIDGVIPIFDQDRGGSDFSTERDRALVPVES